MVDRRISQQLIKSPSSNCIGKADIALIGQNDHADVLVEFETDIGTKAVRASVVPNDTAIWGLSDDPAKRVGNLVVYRHLRSSGDGQIFRRDDSSSLEAAVAQLQT